MINTENKILAINGGIPVRTKKWLDNFTVGEEEKLALSRVIDSGYLSLFEGSHTPDPPFSFKGGPEVQKLEELWCEYYGSKYSVSVNSATSGLYMAIAALGIGFGDEVIVSPYTMTACALAPLIYGAIPVFADVELNTGSLDPKSIEKVISTRTKAIIVVHQFGIPADMDQIMKIADKYNIKVIEDCAQAHGAIYGGKHVGTIGDIGVFSLNVNKTIQTGEGGICTTNNEDLAYRLQLVRNHGEAVVGPAGYENITNIAGFNYRLTELQAAIAVEQLKKLDIYNRERLELVHMLYDGLAKFDFLKPLCNRSICTNNCPCETKANTKATFYVFPIRFIPDIAGTDRDTFTNAWNAEGINFFQGYVKPLYYQPLYQNKHLYKHGYPFTAPQNKHSNMDYSIGLCPNAEKLHFEQMLINEHIRLPHSKEDINDIIRAVNKIVK